MSTVKNSTRDEIADAAIDFVEARLKAADLRERRADILRDEECAGQNDCYTVERLPLAAWCARCLRAQAVHAEYRKAASHRTATLIKLKRMVMRREIAQTVNA
jgi:hypothetical protein